MRRFITRSVQHPTKWRRFGIRTHVPYTNPMLPKHRAPIWLMGLSNATFGLVGGFIVLPLPQLLAARGVPELRIAAISAACLSPGFWVFLV